MSPFVALVVSASIALAVLALAASVALAGMRRRPIEAYRLAVLLLIGACVLPLAQFAARGWSRNLPWSQSLGSWLQAEQPTVTADSFEGVSLAELELLERATTLGALSELPAPTEGAFGRAWEWLRVGAPWFEVLVGTYLAGVAWALVRTTRRLLAARVLVRASHPVHDPGLRTLWRELCTEDPRRRRIRLRSVDGLRAPACCGLARDTVLLPPTSLLPSSKLKLRAVLLHEIVHLQRRDSWTMLLQELFRCAFWFHPAAWWMRLKLDTLRELSCDMLVVRHTRHARSYATALVECAQNMGDRHTSVPAAALLPLTPFDQQLTRRIEMLVFHPNSLKPRRLPLALASSMLFSLWGTQVTLAGALLGPEDPTQECQAPEELIEVDLPAAESLASGASLALARPQSLQVNEQLAQILAGDVIAKINGQSVGDTDSAVAALRNASRDDEDIVIEIVRGDDRITIRIGSHGKDDSDGKVTVGKKQTLSSGKTLDVAKKLELWQNSDRYSEYLKTLKPTLEVLKSQGWQHALDGTKLYSEWLDLFDGKARDLQKNIQSYDSEAAERLRQAYENNTKSWLDAVADESANTERWKELVEQLRKNHSIENWKNAAEKYKGQWQETLNRLQEVDYAKLKKTLEHFEIPIEVLEDPQPEAEEDNLRQQLEQAKRQIAEQKAKVERLMKRLKQAESGQVH